MKANNTLTKDNFKKLMAALIDGLPTNQKVVLSLYYCEELTFEEIASVLSITVGQVRNLYVRAMSNTISTKPGNRKGSLKSSLSSF